MILCEAFQQATADWRLLHPERLDDALGTELHLQRSTDEHPRRGEVSTPTGLLTSLLRATIHTVTCVKDAVFNCLP